MIVTLEEAKEYLRVDSNDEDALITEFILASENICEGVLRFSLTEFLIDNGTIPEIVKQSVLYSSAQFYELRESINVGILVETLKRFLFAYRKESW